MDGEPVSTADKPGTPMGASIALTTLCISPPAIDTGTYLDDSDIFTNTEHFLVTKPDGTEIKAESCDNDSGCIFPDGELDGGSVIIHPIDNTGGCKIYFTYRGEDFEVESEKYGYDNAGF
ncbi:hypothetical protein VN97_g1170 [Penicillium thymicola]|uniref:Uncharacterized protein n=1 Tax=Penicillium thymicola TaxID=293382 RepID=A0AAI9XC99_PENTH|nr:hypothetical protein VN97_g1170 [Penicillium thymicola]